MPRRKQSRQPRTSRSRPKLPEGALETSLTEDERKSKMDIYLKDFDLQVEARLKKIDALGTSLIQKINSAYKLEILKLPLHIRKMKLADYKAQGGKLNDDAVAQTSKIVTEMAKSIFQIGNGDTPAVIDIAGASGPQRTVRNEQNKAVGLEPSTGSRSLRPRKRKGVPMSPSTTGRQMKAKAPKTAEKQMPPPSTTHRRNNQTPAMRGPGNFTTPMVMPKFDPRLPMTPAVLREAKAGERIMSLRGSPIVNRGPLPLVGQVFIPMKGGQTFHVSSKCHLSPSQTPHLDDVAKKNIQLLQEQLSRLLQVPPHLKTVRPGKSANA